MPNQSSNQSRDHDSVKRFKYCSETLVQVMPLLCCTAYGRRLLRASACAHSVHLPCKTAGCTTDMSQPLPSTIAVSIFQQHSSWMLLAATSTALVTMSYVTTYAVPVSPVHVKQYILRPPLPEPCKLYKGCTCDSQRVLIIYNTTSPGGISQACQTMDKHNRRQHECCRCKCPDLKRSFKNTGVSTCYVTTMGSKGQVPCYNTSY